MKTIKANLFNIDFEPEGFFKNGHVQTIYAATFYNPKDIKDTEKIKIAIDDKTIISCDYNRSKYFKANSAVILIHGTEADSKVNYVVSTAKKLLKEGFDTFRMNMRNCGDTMHLTNTLYHGGLSEDLNRVINYCLEKYHYQKIFLVGFSLGGNLALKLAGELRDNYPKELSGVCAICPPIKINYSTNSITKSVNKFYESYFLSKIFRSYFKKKFFSPNSVNLRALLKVKSAMEFDKYILGPHFNFDDLDAFYQNISAYYYLPDIELKTLIIQSEDDPIVPADAFKEAMQNKVNSKIDYLLTKHGGHVGFINSDKLAELDIDCFWAENRVVDFVANN